METQFRWFGHIERRPVDFIVKRINKMEDSEITIGRGRSRKTTRETIKKDLEINKLDRNKYMIENYGIV